MTSTVHYAVQSSLSSPNLPLDGHDNYQTEVIMYSVRMDLTVTFPPVPSPVNSEFTLSFTLTYFKLQ
jgi:hypothetical protein